MMPTSAKSPSKSKSAFLFTVLALLSASPSALAPSAMANEELLTDDLSSIDTGRPKSYSYTGSFDARIAGHLRPPRDLASQRLGVAFEQKYNISPEFRAVAGFRAWNEAAYSTNFDRYPTRLAQEDSRDLRFRDLYLQYQNENFTLRVGNQQVVWGEAFGFFYSDIVNPKDLRDGLFGNLADTRLQIPMINAKLVFSEFSVQAIAVPKPYFNLVAAPGSDFAYPYQTLVSVPNIQVNREESLPLEAGNQEYGGRVSYLWGSLDLSAFYFNYFDRNPYYVIGANTSLPQTLVLQERHNRIQSFGLTATNDFDGYVVRFEGLTTRDRTLPTVVNSTLGTARSDAYIYVIGLDVPTWEKFNLGLQWSQDILSSNPQGLLRTRVQSLITLRLQRSFFSDHSADLLYSYSVSDAGQRGQLNYLIPISGSFETGIGVDVLGGPFSSDFGKLYQGSRAFALIKYFLKG